MKLLILPLLACCAVWQPWAGPRLNQIQVVGTHNSYHIAPHPSLAALIRSQSAALADSIDYSHRPLAEQFERLGIRQVELDLHADPVGGLHARPGGVQKAAEGGLPPPPAPPAATMVKPGIKVLHFPDFDYQTTAPTFAIALEEIRGWSAAHPAHLPIMILLELKADSAGPEFAQAVPWDEKLLPTVEAEILQVFKRSQILAPDDVRGGHPTLREAILDRGWPELGDARGKVMFALDNEGELRDRYLGSSRNLAGKLLFVSVEESHPAAAWFKVNNAVADFERIQRLVKAGFLVRTRADSDTKEARSTITFTRDKAFASGAQFVSTDYPEPNRSWGDYVVRWPGGIVARPNPISLPEVDPSLDMERLAPKGLAPFCARELEHLNARAFQLHRARRLEEASADYDTLLALDPPASPSDALRRVAMALAPTLRRVQGDPFPLEALVTIHHPSRPLVAYHLFWADDIDFPDDNDPTDHEVLWVEYDPETLKSRRLFSYFHGRILEVESRGSDPVFAVEWGKHGSLPFADPSEKRPYRFEMLESNWRRLAHSGRQSPNSALATGWPARFEGDFEDYTRFDVPMDLKRELGRGSLQFQTKWANAAINRRALRLNFAAKLEWPAE